MLKSSIQENTTETQASLPVGAVVYESGGDQRHRKNMSLFEPRTSSCDCCQSIKMDGHEHPHQHQARPEAAVRNFGAWAAAVEVDLGKIPLLAHLRDFRQSVGIVPAELPFNACDRPRDTVRTTQIKTKGREGHLRWESRSQELMFCHRLCWQPRVGDARRPVHPRGLLDELGSMRSREPVLGNGTKHNHQIGPPIN